METTRKSLKGSFYRKVAIYFLAYSLILNTSLPAVLADAVPGMIEGENVTSGSATFTTVDDTTTILTGGPQTIIEYTLFNVDGGKTVHFDQPDVSAATLNRIIEANPSLINGNLTSNGRVFIVNPAGVIFGETASVNVAQLVASGLNMTDEAFEDVLESMDNYMAFSGGDGDVTNNGSITASDSVYLVGKNVTNNGTISCPGGLVVMAAGDQVYLAQDGSNVVVEVGSLSNVTNESDSLVIAGDGDIVLAAGDSFSCAIVNAGLLYAPAGTITAKAARIESGGDRSIISTSATGSIDNVDGGSISLTARDEVVLDTGTLTTADAGLNGNGGNITIETDGTVTVGEDALITARGGIESGDGGYVKITSEHFAIAGDIDASPGNLDYELGTLEIDPADITIAAGTNTGDLDTIYEEDIEALSEAGTNLVVYADESITVEDIPGNGIIQGRYGDIELHATGADSSVSFNDKEDSIKTTLGNIIIEAGSGGIDIGSLETSKDASGTKPTAGRISLATENGGDITTENLIIKSGWGRAEIKVDASGGLVVNGDVIVGDASHILNVPNGEDAEAMILLSAGDDVLLEGNVGAYSHGKHPGEIGDGITKSYIGIFGGTNELTTEEGKVTINGDLVAKAKSSEQGVSQATIEVAARGDIIFGPNADKPLADGDSGEVHVESYTSDKEENEDGDVAEIIINPNSYPGPLPIAHNDIINIPKDIEDVFVDVLDNDMQGGETLDGFVHDYDLPVDFKGKLNKVPPEGDIIGFTYEPPEDLTVLTFDEEGKATVTFIYWAEDDLGFISEDPATVTITLINELPVANPAAEETNMNVTLSSTLQDYISDADGDPLTTALVDGPSNAGSFTLNPDGTFTYTPEDDYVGPDSFTYSVTDSFNSASETVTITVNPVEEPPPPPPPPPTPVTPFVPAAPLPETVEFEISGCLALMNWTAEELGTDAGIVQIWMENILASARDMHPCNACANLKGAATILQDAEGAHIAALAQVINEFASSTAPPSEEQMASIAEAIARNIEPDSNYALAGEYLDALAEYVGILNTELGFTIEESVIFAADKYVIPLAESENVGLAAYVAARLAALGG